MITSGCRNTAAIVVPRFNYGYGRPSLRVPHKLQIGTEYPLSIEGEGWGEGEHKAAVVIPFTLC